MIRKLATLALISLTWMTTPVLAIDIDDIQVYDGTGAPASPVNGTIQTIQGVITVFRGTYNSGTHYVQDATGGISMFDPASPALAVGDEVSVTGTVSTFSGEIQLSSTTFTYISTPGAPAPLALTVAEAVDNDNSGTQTADDYEIIGTLATVTGQIAYLPGVEAPPFPTNTGQGTFGLTNGVGDTLQVFIDRTTGIDSSGLGNGETFAITSPVANFNGVIQLKPRFQADLVENPSDPFPLVSDVTPNPWTPETNESVDVTATITDAGGVLSATLFYKDASSGSFSSVAMSNIGGDTYEGTIPGTTDSGLDYYVVAEDTSNQITSVPGDAPASFLSVAVGTTSIITIQSTLQAGGDASAFSGQLVNVDAIVTVAPGELQTSGTSNYALGEEEGGEWSGIFIFEGSGANAFFRGDRVRMSGIVSEFNGITEILPQSGASIELQSINNPLPPISPVSTSEADTTEAWEAVIIRTFASAVCDTIFGGDDWTMIDTVSDSCLYVDPAPGVTITANVDDNFVVTGMLDTRFGRNDIVPRNDADIQTLVGVEPPTNGPKFRGAVLTQVHPNPFNPSTTIKFDLPRRGLTDLAIFTARGERVKTLAEGRMDPGEHTRVWNGLDSNGEAVASGVYYARLRFETERPSIYKLTLVK